MGDLSSWAFLGLHLLSRPSPSAALRPVANQEAILLGAAHLLGLLLDKAQTRRAGVEEELRVMKMLRAEDAKANEKVVSIFSSHEQSWIAEKKSLRLQIRALSAQLQSLKSKNDDNVSNLNYRIAEAECEIRLKDEAIEREAEKTRELEEELRAVKKEEQHRIEELEKQRAAAARAVEREKEEAATVDKLSDRIAKMQNDAEQKEKILSALLRKSKLDTAEKQMLLKELKMSKAKKKQAELEAEKWREKWESRHIKKSSSRQSCSVEGAGCSQEKAKESSAKNLLLDYFESEWERERGLSEAKGEIDVIKCLDQYSNREITDQTAAAHDIKNLRDRVRMETEKYATTIEQKHFAEIEAFTEQMRAKDEKLEAFRWRLLGKDMQSKRMQSQVEVLQENISRLRDENFKLEALLLDREAEIKSLKDRISFFLHHNHSSEQEVEIDSARRNSGDAEIKFLKRAQGYRDQIVDGIEEVNSSHSPLSVIDDCSLHDNLASINEICSEESTSRNSYDEQARSMASLTNSPYQEIEEEKDVVVDQVHGSPSNNSDEEGNAFGKTPRPAAKSVADKESTRKMDIHALGVSYKIKRLKQQLIMLEKLAGVNRIVISSESPDTSPIDKKIDDGKQHLKGVALVIYLLSKQVRRFQSLEEKTDDLCRRMHESTTKGGGGGRSDSKSRREQSRALETFLEETFQLQRFMVATGQKLMEIQSKIIVGIGNGDGVDESFGFNMEHFVDVIGTLFRDIQRGLEVRIARIIGDIEGTLACDGIRRI